jgi:hypothetical protein
MKALLTGVLALLVVGLAGMASAASYEESLKDALAGKSAAIVLPESDKQIVSLVIGPNVNYIVDVKLHYCYYAYTLYEGVGSNTHATFAIRSPLSCQNLKKGFPMIAPLITWND